LCRQWLHYLVGPRLGELAQKEVAAQAAAGFVQTVSAQMWKGEATVIGAMRRR
jgi:hypothetical protein